MNRALLVLVAFFVCAVTAFHDSHRYGILYTNEILANSDTHSVQIDGSFVKENVLSTDLLEEWTGHGIHVEGVFLKNKNAYLFNDFVVHPATSLPENWHLYFNGGLVADSPYDDLFSFRVEDNTGRTSIRGVLRPGSGVSLDNGVFTIADNSGETTVKSAILHANGGINTNDGAFAVLTDGTIETESSIHINGNVYLGNTLTDDIYVSRVQTFDKFGGRTQISTQDGIRYGGNLYLLPGEGSDFNGNIFFGREQGDDIYVQRELFQSTAAAGDTYILGQSSANAAGGSIVISAGHSTGNGDGGDIVLAPGTTSDDDEDFHTYKQGAIILGTDVEGLSAYDLFIQRPDLRFGDGGDTFFRGQSTENGVGGDLVMRAGKSQQNDASVPGNLYLSSGLNQNNTYNDIVVGTPRSADLFITRFTVPAIGGDTFWIGQSSIEGAGGHLILRAGNGEGNGNGGDLHLVPGLTNTTAAGHIYLGSNNDHLIVGRHDSQSGGLDTFIEGQRSVGAVGGDLYLLAGDSAVLVGGDLNLSAGDGASGSGGDITFEAGNGGRNGGDINFSPSLAVESNPGEVAFIAGGGSFGRGGSIYFNAGSGDQLGYVSIAAPSASTQVRSDSVLIKNSYFLFETNTDALIIEPSSSNIVTYNNKVILRSVADYPVVYPDVNINPLALDFPVLHPAAIPAARYMTILQDSLHTLINNLGQCQHGLIELYDSDGTAYGCDLYANAYSGEYYSYDAPIPDN